jgi:beta-aspartyl-peptidase (threonine type)
MERLPHVFLVGEGAARFAAEMGFEPVDLLTEEAHQVWEERLRRDMPDGVRERLHEEAELSHWVTLATDPERAGGTVNFIAQDAAGDIACGVSTSGWAWKYPGRLGDSPLIGAGNYADSRFGAAACTGMGEMAIRAATAHSAILYMKSGMSLGEAGAEAMRDLAALGGPYVSMMHLLVVDRNGRHAGFSTTSEKTYVYQTAEMAQPAEAGRTQIPIASRWGEPA